jgi:hypothetical protein
LVATIIAIALLITGVQILVAGLTGRRMSIPLPGDDDNSKNSDRQ